MNTCKRCKRCNRAFLGPLDGDNWEDYAPSKVLPDVCWSCLTHDEADWDAMIARVTDPDYLLGHYTTAFCLMEMWDVPSSVQRATNATLALRRARRAGCDVMENPRVMESLEMLAGLR